MNNRKLKLVVRGKLYKNLYKFSSYINARRIGVNIKEQKFIDDSTAELLLEGDSKRLWKLLHWHLRGPILCDIKEVSFQFTSLV